MDETETKRDLPALHPDELAEIRRIAGHDNLTNDEAQTLLRDAKNVAAFNLGLMAPRTREE